MLVIERLLGYAGLRVDVDVEVERSCELKPALPDRVTELLLFLHPCAGFTTCYSLKPGHEKPTQVYKSISNIEVQE